MKNQHDFKSVESSKHPATKLEYALLPTGPVVRYCVRSDTGLRVENTSLSTALAMIEFCLDRDLNNKR